MSKSIFASKTLWINIVGIVVAIAQVLPPKYSVPAIGIANIINRLFTDTPVHILDRS